ncbi:MAG: hypothetical protein MR598_01905 [Erysipelotrichaceae bacterium]|nr:hypothetical protein [Erysipelotrichaceae bacterium]
MFDTGNIVKTRGINEAMKEDNKFKYEVISFFTRYMAQDWGDLCDKDKEENDKALLNDNRILACYLSKKGKVYIITEADRSTTTIMFASEY